MRNDALLQGIPPPLPSKWLDEGLNLLSSDSLDATESLPIDKANEKGKRGRMSPWSSKRPMRELAQTILKFGEIYE